MIPDEVRECEGCYEVVLCHYSKAAHVPMYSWRCEKCRPEWQDEN